MAKKTAAAPALDWAAPRLAGKTFLFGHVPKWHRGEFRRLIQAEGGSVVEKVTEQLDFLVYEGPRPSVVLARKVDQLNARKGASILVLDSKEFFALFAPTREEGIAMLSSGQEGANRWNALRCIKPPKEGVSSSSDDHSSVPMPSLGAVDLRKAVLCG